MASFSANGTSRVSLNTVIRIEKNGSNDTKTGQHSEQSQTKEIWAKAKSYAHDQLWFGYILPGLLQSEGISTENLPTGELCAAIADIWDTKSYEINGQVSVVMSFTHEDKLLIDYDGEKPTRYDKETTKRVPVELNALASVGSNDFRWYVMSGDEWTSPLIPNNCFFGTYPVKYKGEIQKGKFRCILKQKK